MSTIDASYSRDNNRVPITTDGITSSSEITLVGSGAAVTVPVFHVTGSIEVRALYGVVTTNLANHTAAAWLLNDQGATIYITAVGGTSLTNIKAGSMIVKKGLVGAALTALTNANGVISEPTTLETTYFSPFVMVKKTAAVTDIEYGYTTSDTPTTGAIKFYLRWLPLSDDAAVTAI